MFKHAVGDFSSAVKIQKNLQKASVALIGLGGVSSYIFYTLSAMSIGKIISYEFDVVEESNLSRQMLYTYDDTGMKKIEVAKKKGKRISPTTKYLFYDQKIETFDHACLVFEDVDLVICAADMPRPEFFYLMNKASYARKIPLLYAESSTHNAVIGPLVISGKRGVIIVLIM
ncbi:ThiF family adenylyltransferase [Bartonella rattaustraliani]|uniref:HesA/MoeB/ThiF family protein n=1 Tax=Bartonella rattaustraliani TaxID=481139 RepID=UPI0006890FE7